VSSVNASGVLTTYTWDADDQLTRAEYSGGGEDNFTYDGSGLRVGRSGASGGARFVWDGLFLVQEGDEQGQTRAHFTGSAGGAGGPLAQRTVGRAHHQRRNGWEKAG
jgi:YD repeat-containing protein